VLTWAMAGRWPTLADARAWILEPWAFFDGVFIATGLLCAFSWHRASVVAGIFHRLALTPGELAFDAERREGGFWRSGHRSERASVSRVELVDEYVSQWLIGGIFLAFCAAATRVRVGQGLSLSLLDMGIPPQIVGASVFYFLIGLALTSQARLAVLRAQWLQDGVEMPERLPSRWSRFSLLIIIGIGVLAALLPLGSTWQIGAIINAVVMFFVQIALFVIFLATALFALIMRLFDQTQPMPELPQELAPAEPVAPVPWVQMPEWLGGASLWLLVIVALLLALRFLLGEDGLNVTKRRLRQVFARLSAYFRSWWQEMRRLAQSVQVNLSSRRNRVEGDAAARQPWRFIRLGALPPREQVRYFYLSTVRRAAERGITRQPAQTPLEFVQDLERTWPEAEIEMEALTGAFVTARYDDADISPGEAQQVKSIWERIKQALRGRRVTNTGGSDGLH
jgi:hypothetical protein